MPAEPEQATPNPNEELNEKPNEDDDDDSVEQALCLPTRKKKKRTTQPEAPTAEAPHQAREFTYMELLDRLYRLARDDAKHKPAAVSTEPKLKLPVPQLARVGSKSIKWLNFDKACALLHRTQEHAMMYVIAELSTEGNLDSRQRLLLRGKYKSQDLAALLKKYVCEYVTCHTCQSTDTTLVRESTARLSFLECCKCGASRCVPPIKAGFRAVTRLDRKRGLQAAC